MARLEIGLGMMVPSMDITFPFTEMIMDATRDQYITSDNLLPAKDGIINLKRDLKMIPVNTMVEFYNTADKKLEGQLGTVVGNYSHNVIVLFADPLPNYNPAIVIPEYCLKKLPVEEIYEI